MNKLVVNPGTEVSWEIILPEGAITLGSDPSLPYPIAHYSVSPNHCEITVADGQVHARDLGSVCGTFLDHAQVTDTPLVSGQTLCLGEVEMRFISDELVDSPLIPKRIAPFVRIASAGAAGTLGNAACKFHPKSPAAWHCETCQMDYCDLCINIRRVGDSSRHLCRKCDNDCAPVKISYATSQVVENFYSLLPGAFSYPFKGSGSVLIVAGGVFFTGLTVFMSMARYAFLFGLVAILMCSLFFVGYLFTYAKSVISETAQGANEPPDWPDFTDWGDSVLLPAFQAFCLVVAAFGPALAVSLLQPLGEEFSPLAALLLLLGGALVAPMGMMALGIFDSLGALNPVAMVQSIVRIPLTYLVAAAVFELVVVAYLAVAQIHPPPGLITLAVWFVRSMVQLYTLLVTMRILGLLYRTQKDKLGWT